MATAADKKKWDTLHAAYAKASEALLAYEIQLGGKHGHKFQTQWLSSTERKKLEKLRDAKEKVGEKIYELVDRISPRRWDQGVPSWWVRERLTWEDAIRPADEPLSVVVPGAFGYHDGYVKESNARVRAQENMNMPRGISKDLENFKEVLAKGVLLVGGEIVDNNSIDLDDDDPVSVAIVVNVQGYGPHVGAIAVTQGGHIDEALQVADEILEEWEMDHNPGYYAELEKEYGEAASEVFRETFDGIMWELSPREFADAIKGTKAAEFIEIDEPEEEEEENEDDPEYVIQGLYSDGTLVSGYEYGYDDEDETIREAQKIADSSSFEGDYVRVITRDGELVWDSREGED